MKIVVEDGIYKVISVFELKDRIRSLLDNGGMISFTTFRTENETREDYYALKEKLPIGDVVLISNGVTVEGIVLDEDIDKGFLEYSIDKIINSLDLTYKTLTIKE